MTQASETCEIETLAGSLGIRIKSRMFKARVGKKLIAVNVRNHKYRETRNSMQHQQELTSYAN